MLRSLFGFLKQGAGIAAQLVLLAAVGVAFTVRTPSVSGVSMEPQLDSGEIVLVDVMTYRLTLPRRGDIIVFRRDDDGALPALYVKRVIGLPGDVVGVRDGVVFRNGARVGEPYVRFPDHRDAPVVQVPPDAYYVLGDNRAQSEDSRDWGFVRRSQISGRALFALWPPQRAGAL